MIKGQGTYSKLIGIMIHLLLWVVFGLVLFFYQPYLSNIDVPYQFWVKQVIILGMLVIAYYINSGILVPRFLLKNRTAYYLLMIVILVAGIIFLTGQVDHWLNVHRLMDTAFHKHWIEESTHKPGPPKPGKGGRGGLDTVGIAITALVLGISTSVTVIQKWQKDKAEREELEKDKVTSE